MLVDPRKLIVLLLTLLAVTAGAVAFASSDLQAMRAGIPGFGGDEPYDVDVRSFSARPAFAGEGMVAINEARLERDVEIAIRGLAGAGAAGSVPASLATMRRARGGAGVRAALDGIPRRELALETFVRTPDEPLDPWTADVLVDVRAIAGDEPDFATPTSEVTVQVRPWGDASEGVVTRWQVERVSLERGGLPGLARDVVYIRRGNVGVVAPTADRATAEEIAGTVDAMQAETRRRYRGLSDGRAAFVALVPSRHHLERVYDAKSMPSDAVGTAYDESRMAILRSAYESDPSFVRRDLLRHELVHLATADLTRAWEYPVYVEGVAEWEGNHEIVEAGTYYMNNGPAVDAVQSGRIDLDALLFDANGWDDVDEDHGYRIGSLVVDHMESRYGHARTVKFYRLLADGVAPRVAVYRAFKVRPGTFRDDVRATLAANRTWMG